ncbi:MAG: deoxyribose-phosphate aldolase, partial [Gemmatimonadetes bacterium]|nr:deoxyribose-phosphate aldolase [Gemmatimonadota bacterium]
MNRTAAEELARRVAAEFVRLRSRPAARPAAAGAAPPRAPGVAAAAPATRSTTPARGAAPDSVAKYVDHTLLKAAATSAEIVKLCREARAHSFAAVCLNPVWVELAAQELAGSDVAVATVVGFPLGATTTAAKVAEAEDALGRGATELDMVAQIGKIKEGDWAGVADDIRELAGVARGR